MISASTLSKTLAKHTDVDNAMAMKAYMKNKFDFFGIRSPDLVEIFKTYLAPYPKITKAEMIAFVKDCWQAPEREMQMCAMKVLVKHKKQWDNDYFQLFEYMIQYKSWWDSVDFIAVNLVGVYLKSKPTEIETSVKRWMKSENMWLMRTAILFQLKYKTATDEALLFGLCEKLKDSKEFFIRKAIGWALREYSKTKPQQVVCFVEETALHSFSKREALKWLNRTV